ncbi:MAG TPA: pantoate--beta-alanine ligase [Xanthobacteraceae bacterium]|jgi:pantoate--beta-alanine ligase|nr:pantoate--beta-alanine ligase [Xanthobacteraceae bacterium]
MNNKKSKRYPRVIRTLPSLRRAVAEFRARRATVALVPTMGALHEGHFSLVRIAKARADRVIVSIFVNPTQFAPNEDLGTYPRTWSADLAALKGLKADLVWAPPVETMYPDGFATRIVPEGPASVGLEDAFRSHFFAGVATVVAKLLIQCEPDIAMFGEKDYQQLKVVSRLARDLALKTRIVGAAIVRDKDGFALSSRNRYLSADERAAAPALYRTLKECAARIRTGGPVAAALDDARAAIAKAGFALDYLEARNADTLAPLAVSAVEPIRLLVAAKIGKTRLIDNVAV